MRLAEYTDYTLRVLMYCAANRDRLVTIAEIADSHGLTPAEVARVHFALGERLGLSVLQRRIVDLPRADQWQTMARAAQRDDLHAVHAQLTAQVLDQTPDTEEGPEEATERVATWEEAADGAVAQATDTLSAICADEESDIARVSVGLRVVRSLLT